MLEPELGARLELRARLKLEARLELALSSATFLNAGFENAGGNMNTISRPRNNKIGFIKGRPYSVGSVCKPGLLARWLGDCGRLFWYEGERSRPGGECVRPLEL